MCRSDLNQIHMFHLESYEHNLGMVCNDPRELHNAFTTLSTDQYELMAQNVQADVEKQHNYSVLYKKLMSFLSINTCRNL